MSIPDPTPESAAPAGWYPTGETGPDGLPVERYWDGAQWSAMVRPLGVGASGRGRSNRAKSLIAAGAIVVLAGVGVGLYFALDHGSSNNNNTAGSNSPTTGPTTEPNNGSGNGGLGGGTGGLGGLGGSTSSATPQSTVTGGSGQTVSDPIDELTIPVPSGWTGTSGSTSGSGSFASLATGTYTCPSGLATSSGSSTAATTCTRGGVTFNLDTGSTAQGVATKDISTVAGDNYGSLSSHKVVDQGAITVAGRAGYQITWSVVPSYSGPSGTVELIALPVPGESGYYTLIDIGVDQSSQAPSLSTVNSQIIAGIADSSAAGA